MAFLTNDDDETREAWLMYAIEFARRGLWLCEDCELETHGPHGPHGGADRIWGTAQVRWHEWPSGSVEVTFATASGKAGIWDISGIRVKGDEGCTFPILPASKLPGDLRAFIKTASAEREALRRAAMGTRKPRRK